MSSYYDCLDDKYRVIVDGIAYPTTYDHTDAIRQMPKYDKMRPDDVIVCSYPRSGTHLSIALVDLVMRNGDIEAADKIHINQRSIWMHMSQQIWNGEVSMAADGINPMTEAEMWPSPRLLCSHLCLEAMPESVRRGICKVVVVLRNPKSVLNSKYQYEILIPEKYQKPLTFDGYLNSHLTEAQDLVSYGTWLNHVSGWWQNRDRMNGNIHFIYYEDMIKDITSVVTKLAKFLNKDLSEGKIKKIAEYLQFRNMKNNPKTGKAFENMSVYAKVTDTNKLKTYHAAHMRKGAIGDWKDKITVAQSERIDDYLRPKLQEIGLEFQYE
ncbi:unnamed protein product [Owenia fusiformis]|uniref:Uncharacterized protein n=1 Tax=Owenia fusiformis TaxID=6347 RepID=A0A8J1UZ89_OWEFU|nr:unnamed protein product [Owenia fusiformis]